MERCMLADCRVSGGGDGFTNRPSGRDGCPRRIGGVEEMHSKWPIIGLFRSVAIPSLVFFTIAPSEADCSSTKRPRLGAGLLPVETPGLCAHGVALVQPDRPTIRSDRHPPPMNESRAIPRLAPGSLDHPGGTGLESTLSPLSASGRKSTVRAEEERDPAPADHPGRRFRPPP